MKSLSIHEPMRAVGINAASQRLLSDDPREGSGVSSYFGGEGIGLDLSFSNVVTLSGVFFGYITSLPSDALFYLTGVAEDGNAETTLINPTPVASSRREALSHAYGTFNSFTAKSLRLRIIRSGSNKQISTNGVTVGVASALRAAFRAQWGHEWGAGRPLDDTSAVERLPSGSFAIDRGVVTSGYQWTFGDLSDDERERLYDIHRAVGRSRSVLVIEDDDRTPGLYERMHWGLLAKLDTYARADPTATTWGMQVADWL